MVCAVQGGRTGIANNELRSMETCCLARMGYMDWEAMLRDSPITGYAACSWQPAGPMCHPRTAVAAASLGTSIYAVGGQARRSLHRLPC